jgi:4-hydroxybenzoyl-CoA thioesterase
MGTRQVIELRIEWGDTDPARIVFYPNYFRWFDAACHQLFDALGVSHNTLLDDGVAAGYPIVEAHAEFKRPGYYSDWIEIRAEVVEVGAKVLKVAYQAWRDDVLLLEGYEKRVIARHDTDEPRRMRAMEISATLRDRLLGTAP